MVKLRMSSAGVCVFLDPMTSDLELLAALRAGALRNSELAYSSTSKFSNTPYSRSSHYVSKARLGGQASWDTMVDNTIWCKNLAYLPRITHAVVDSWANDEARIPRSKHQQGYSNWIEGYLIDIEGKWVFRNWVFILYYRPMATANVNTY